MISAVEAQKRLWQRKKEIVQAYKAARGCAHCGEHDGIVLELHHRNPAEKHPKLKAARYRGTGGSLWRTLSYNDLAAELEKCDVLCANCHRRETARQREEM